MLCPKCKEDLSFFGDRIYRMAACPFCKSELEQEQIRKMLAQDRLKKFYEEKGKEALFDQQTLWAELNGWPEDLKKEAKIIKLLSIEDIVEALVRNKLSEEFTQEQLSCMEGVVGECIQKLVDDFDFAKNKAFDMVERLGILLFKEDVLSTVWKSLLRSATSEKKKTANTLVRSGRR